MLAAIKDWHQTLSCKLGYGRGKMGELKNRVRGRLMQGKEAAN
jgi:hypothetical protein